MVSVPRLSLVLVGLIAAFTIACGGNGGSDAKGSVETFFNAFNDHDADKMYDLFAKDCLQGVTKEQFKTAMDFGFAFMGDSKVKIESISIKEDGDRATATVKGKFEGGMLEGEPADEGEMALSKEDGKWKIADCSFIQGIGEE